MWSPTRTLSNVSAPPTLKDRGPKRTARDPRSPLRIGANYAITSMGDIVALQCDGQSVAQQPQTKPRSNESTTPTLNPPRVDRAHSTRRTGLFALALGTWVLAAVTLRPCSICLSRETSSKNMAGGPRSAKPNPLSVEQTQTNQIERRRSPHGP